MEQNLDVMTATVSTDCTCEDYNEELGEFVPMEYCYGDCYEMQKEDVFYVIGEWQKLNEIDEDDLEWVACMCGEESCEMLLCNNCDDVISNNC